MKRWLRFLLLLANRQELQDLSWRRFLAPALLATWLAGIGRYWDHPSASPLQKLGLGSVVYVFALSALLWLVIAPLRPKRWSYVQVVTLVALTSPPAWLYAIPVERFMSMTRAIEANAWFLALVAAWRVALLLFLLRRYAELTWIRTIVGSLLPLAAIVATLFALNLEHAVFEFMGGFHRPPTPNDGAYAVLFLLTFLSMAAAVPLLLIYFVLVVISYRERLRQRSVNRAG